MLLKKIYIKIDDKRETIEDFIADKILFNLDENEKVDALEEEAILAAMDAAALYLKTYGVPTLPDEIKKKIAKASVKAIGKANKKIQKQLKKKSASYEKRHGENPEPETAPKERPHFSNQKEGKE